MERETLKELILNKIKNGKTTILKLSKNLSISEQEVKSILKELKNELLIKEQNDSYVSTQDRYHRLGKLSITKNGLGVVKITTDEVYFINECDLNNSIDGDTVLIKILDPLKRTALIEDKKEEERNVVGTIHYENGNVLVDLDNPLLKLKLKLNNSQGPFEEGDKVLIKFISRKGKTTYKAEEVEFLGSKDEIGIDITSIIKELGISDKFSSSDMEEISKIKTYVDEEDIKDRRDLRNYKIFTIDGSESKDFDDAIGIELLENNHYLLKVCIADVDYYVKESSNLDETAKKRSSSVYLLDRTIPMLPFELSNGICSLNPLEDRLTLTYEMEYDEEGQLVDYDIYLSVINSSVRMTYDNVEDVLKNENSQHYKEFQTELKLSRELSKKLHNIRVNNGYVDINEKLRKIDYNKEQGKIDNVHLEEIKESQKIIEEFMIAANKIGTLYAAEHNIPILRRVQNDEPREVMEEKLDTLVKMGFKKFDFPLNYSNNDIIREILQYYKDDENINTIIRVITNSNRAYYTMQKISHSSLNEEHYAHFTSPIRRYPDLYSSRQIKKHLKKEQIEQKATLEVIKQINEKSEDIRLCYYRQEGLKLAQYYYEKDEFMNAKVIYMNERIITIQLEDLTTGVIPIKTISGYKFNEKTFSCVNKNNETIKIGDFITVKVVDIDKYFGKSNFKVYKV